MASYPKHRARAALAGALAIWALCGAGSARADPRGRLTFRSFGTRQGLSNLVVTQLLQGVEGLLWVGTEDGLFRFDGKQFDRFGTGQGLPTGNIVALAQGEGRTIWVGTLTGLDRWDGMGFHAITPAGGLPSVAVTGIAARNGRVWVATAMGLYTEVAPDRFAPVAEGTLEGMPSSVAHPRRAKARASLAVLAIPNSSIVAIR